MSKHFENLLVQLEKLRRHNRQGSFRTRARYYEAMRRFCRFAAERYRLERLANLSPKHLCAYAEFLKESGKAPSTIKTELAAIRFFHDLVPDPRYELPDNRGLFLQRRSFGEVDRTWSHREFNRFVLTAMSDGHEDYAAIACLSYYAGLRIHECFRLDTAAAGRALRENAVTVKGKGGKVRTVPINESIRIELRKLLAVTERGHKLFVPDELPTHQAIHRFQQYLGKVRPLVQDEDSVRPMTHHGLRHSYAARTYKELTDCGASPEDASYQVSRLLGHERPDVTRIYLASLRKEEHHGHP